MEIAAFDARERWSGEGYFDVLECSSLAFLVQLVRQRFGSCRVHCGVVKMEGTVIVIV